jgi:hypothetical protein
MNVYDDIKPTAIQIDEEFRDLIPAITPDERSQLEFNIIANGGARDPLVAWLAADETYVLLDGHNRLEICTRLNLPFSVAEVQFEARKQAADWIDRNQLGRRNLTNDGRKLLLGRVYNRAKKAEHDGGKGKKRSGGQSDHHLQKTSQRIACEHGVSEKSVRRAGEFQKAVEKLDLQGDIIRGTVHASQAEVVAAAAALPAEPTPEQLTVARDGLKQRRKAKSSGKAKSKSAPVTTAGTIAVELRTAAKKAWLRLKDKFPPDEHPELRRVLASIIRQEQKQAGN